MIFLYFTAEPSGSNTFIIYLTPLLDWSGAQAYCRKYHTDLATITNLTENNQIKSHIPLAKFAWTGLFRDTWTWVDGIVPSFIPWAFFQPNNLLGAENCGTFTRGLISDETCSYEYAFFCHSSEFYL